MLLGQLAPGLIHDVNGILQATPHTPAVDPAVLRLREIRHALGATSCLARGVGRLVRWVTWQGVQELP